MAASGRPTSCQIKKCARRCAQLLALCAPQSGWAGVDASTLRKALTAALSSPTHFRT